MERQKFMEQNLKPAPGQDSRRDFLKKTATAAAAVAATNVLRTPVYGQNQAPSANVTGANNKLIVGHIGVGGQGTAHLRSQKNYASENNIEQVAVCDVWQKRKDAAQKYLGGNAQGYDDYRKLLERKDIDAVTIATCDHWHTQCSLDAMNSGKHVYVEKPMTRYIGEAFNIYDTAKSTGKIVQVGSQGCSDGKWHVAAKMVREGKIGPLVLAQGSYMRNAPKGEWNYTIDPDAKPDNLDWKFWRGPVLQADTAEFNADHFFRWRKYFPYCAGVLGDLVPHRLHPLMLASGNPEFPLRVVSIGNHKIRTDKNTPGTYYRTVPENLQFLAEFPSGYCIMVISGTVNETGLPDVIRGHRGNLYLAGNRVELKPEKVFADEVDAEPPIEGITPSGEDIRWHEKNWFAAIRGTEKANCGIDLAIRVQTVISLAEMSERLGVTCYFDEKTRKITTGPDGREVQPLTYETEAHANYHIEKV
jgi:predicted dehydrogenase